MAGKEPPRGPIGQTDVVLLSQYMFPESNATSDLLTSLAEGLVASNFSVTAYSAQPSYFSATKVPRLLSHEGVVVKRLWNTRFARRKPIARAINGATFIFRLLLEIPRFQKRAVILAVTNPPFLPVVAALRNVLFGNRFILLVHDVYPEIAVELGVLRRKSPALLVLVAIDRFVLSRADAIVVLGNDMRDRVLKKVRESRRDRIVVIPNWADARSITGKPKDQSAIARRQGLLDTFVVQYSGNLGLSQPFQVILEAARQLAGSNITFTFVGTGVRSEAIVNRVRALEIPNVRLVPRVNGEELGDSLAACDAALVPLSRGLEGLSVPSKYYGILASGRPVIAAMVADAEVARSVVENECGVVVQPDDAEALAAAIRMLASDDQLVRRLGGNSRSAFERLHTRDQAVAAYRDLVLNLVTAGRPVESVLSAFTPGLEGE